MRKMTEVLPVKKCRDFRQVLRKSLLHRAFKIENGLHWVKDVTLQEDYPSRRGGFAPIHSRRYKGG
jgi:predicted transposase YbfD/YdcC